MIPTRSECGAKLSATMLEITVRHFCLLLISSSVRRQQWGNITLNIVLQIWIQSSRVFFSPNIYIVFSKEFSWYRKFANLVSLSSKLVMVFISSNKFFKLRFSNGDLSLDLLTRSLASCLLVAKNCSICFLLISFLNYSLLDCDSLFSLCIIISLYFYKLLNLSCYLL